MSKYEYSSWPSKNTDYSFAFVVRDSSSYNNKACLINLTYHSLKIRKEEEELGQVLCIISYQ